MRLRNLLRRLVRWWSDPLTLIEAMGVVSEPYLCHVCNAPLAPGQRILFSERFGGPVDPDCPQIPMWIRHQGNMFRLIWLRSTERDRVRQALPAPFSLEEALRSMRRPVPAREG